MSLALAAVLMIGGLIAAALLVIGVPLVFGMMAFDLVESRKSSPVTEKDSLLHIAMERGTARLFVLAGGAFWSIAAFAGLYNFRETGVGNALIAASFPLVACAATLIVGWYYERVTAALLLVASLAVVAWGIIYQFEAGVWGVVTFALIGPMLTASVLFFLARREQEEYERVMVASPQLAPVFAARSTLR